MKGRELWIVNCWFGCRGNCPGCQVALNYNLRCQRCHCGAPATGYRAMSLDGEVEFFCDEHFQDVPAPGAVSVADCAIDPAHYGEYGTFAGETISVIGKRMALVKLEHCKHGTDGCYVSPGDIQEVDADDQYVDALRLSRRRGMRRAR